MAIKISEMTPDSSIGGGELIPVSDAGSPKSVTVTGIKAFVVDQIEAIAAGTAVTGADSVYILQGGVLKPVDIDLVAQHAIDTVWGKAADASPAGTDKIAIKDTGTTENTVTLAVLATYIQTAIRAAVIDPTTLSAAGATSTADLFIIGQSGVAKKITLQAVNDAIYAGLAAHVTGLTAATSANDADEFYAVTSAGARKVTLAQMKTTLGVSAGAIAPASMTENYVPQWSATSKTLKDGKAIVGTIAAVGATGTSLVDETAVRTAIYGTGTKTTPVAADIVTVQDSADSGAVKRSTLLQLWDGYFLAKATAAIAGANALYDVMWIPAGAMIPSFIGGAIPAILEADTNDASHDVLDFTDELSDTFVEFNIAMPEAWDLGTIKAKVYWIPEDGESSADQWVRFTLSGRSFKDGEALDAANGTARNIDDQALADDGYIHVTAASPAVTVAGTPAIGSMVHLKLSRVFDFAGSGGTALAGNARVLGVLIQYKKTLTAITEW